MRHVLGGVFFFCISSGCETPSHKYDLIMIKHSFNSPKTFHRNFENLFTNKNLMSKNFFLIGILDPVLLFVCNVII